jgi:hypothetical protein
LKYRLFIHEECIHICVTPIIILRAKIQNSKGHSQSNESRTRE